MKKVVWTILAVVLVLALGACDEKPIEPDGVESDLDWSALEPGLYPILSASDLAGWGLGLPISVRFHIIAVETRSVVQSVQGELRFDDDDISIDDIRFAEPLVGAWHEVAPGTVRFAGVALGGLHDTALFELVVKTRHRPTVEDFTVVLEEVMGSHGGRRFTDLTSDVADRDRPLFSQMPVEGALTKRR